MKRTKGQKAITLIALIITIVVLLILAAVAISSITNDGILSYAQNAAKDYNQAAKNEQDKLQGYLNFLQNGGLGNETDSDLEFIKRYVLGEEGAGRVLTEILDMNTMSLLDDEETTEVDESTEVTFLNMAYLDFKVYIKYGDNAYRIVADVTTNITKSVELVYTPEGREGTPVAYDSNLDGETEEWVIITDRGGKVEIVSNEKINEDRIDLALGLGSADERVTATTDLNDDDTVNGEDIAILSYNNAITTINNYCDELVTATDNDGVRSVGGTNNSASAYHSTNYDNWGSSIIVDVASGDTYDEEDLVKLSYFEIGDIGVPYWFASRLVYEKSDEIDFGIRCMITGGLLSYGNVSFAVSSDSLNGWIGTGGHGCMVRPVVINPEGI